jgi:hypothetical protein
VIFVDGSTDCSAGGWGAGSRFPSKKAPPLPWPSSPVLPLSGGSLTQVANGAKRSANTRANLVDRHFLSRLRLGDRLRAGVYSGSLHKNHAYLRQLGRGRTEDGEDGGVQDMGYTAKQVEGAQGGTQCVPNENFALYLSYRVLVRRVFLVQSSDTVQVRPRYVLPSVVCQGRE